MPTDLSAQLRAGFFSGRLPGASTVLGALLMMTVGCQQDPGNGPRTAPLGPIKVGGSARLVSTDGSDVYLDAFTPGAGGRAARRAAPASKVEKLKLPSGTVVVIEEIVGDDAHVVVKEGASANQHCWVETIRLDGTGLLHSME